MTGSSGEAYLPLPCCSGVLGLLQKLRLKEFAHYDSCLKVSPGWYKRRKDPTGARLSFMELGWLHVFLVMETVGIVGQLFQKRGGIHTSRGFVASCVARKLRPKL